MEGDGGSGAEIVRYRGRRYKRYSSEHTGSISSSSVFSKEDSTRYTSPCLPPVMPKNKYSYSMESFQHQQHKPLPSIGNKTPIENLEGYESELQATQLGNTSPNSHVPPSEPSHTTSSTPHSGWRTPLPPEPDSSDANTVLFKIKLPDNTIIQRRFDFMKDCLIHVILFAHYSSKTEPINLDYVTLSDNNVPKNVYSNYLSTLGEIGLTHNTLLHYVYES